MRDTPPVDIAVVGAGRVGTAVAVLLARAGHRIVGVAGGPGTLKRAATFLPGVPVGRVGDVAGSAEVVLIATPDDAIATACDEIVAAGVAGPGRSVGHLSGATGLSALASAEASGASVFCLHPLQTCPSVEAAIERLPGAGFAVTARSDQVGSLVERLARDLGGVPFRLDDDMKPLYHAAAVLASNALVALADAAQRILGTAGVSDPAAMLAPLQRATLDNLDASSAGDALTGPALRGDASTVEGNLRALADHAPDAVAAYVACSRLALDLATRVGRLDAAGRARVDEVLDRWS